MKQDKVKTSIRMVMDQTDFSGAVSIRQSGKLLYEGARGFRDKANQLENDIQTVFSIASGTKLFTALGIGLLIDQGLLTLSSKVFDLLGQDFGGYDGTVTVAQLLNHTSGIPDYFDEEAIEDFDNFKIAIPWYDLKTPQDYFPVLPRRAMKFLPGEKFQYNNSGYILLAALIAQISGSSYTDFIQQGILEPLKMQNSGFFPMNQLPKNTALGYIKEGDQWRTNVYNLPIVGGGDGGLFTCLDDLYKFWDGVFSGQLISEALVDAFFKDHVKTKAIGDTYYGYGVWLYSPVGMPKRKYIMGADAGISFKSAIIREKELVYTVLSNTGDGAWPVIKAIEDLGFNA